MRAISARYLFAAALLVSAAALSQAPSAGAASGVLLRYHFKAGQQNAYLQTAKVTGSITGLQSKIDLGESLPYTQKVVKVNADGSALLNDTFTKATVVSSGQSSTVPLTSATSSQHIAANGTVLSTKSSGLETGLNSLSIDPSTGSPTFPASPVTVGSHWSARQSFSLGSFGALSGVTHYKVVSLAPVHGHMVATIAITGSLPFNVTEAGTQITGTAILGGTIQFDADAGVLNSTHGKVNVKASLGGGVAAGAAPVTVGLQYDVVRQS